MNQKNRLYLLLGLVSMLTLAFSFSSNTVKKISMIMVARSNKNGKTATIKSEIAYQVAGGKMVSHFTQPNNQYIINNAKGEVSIYDPAKNTVIQQVNYIFSTETTQFYYFLNNQKSDLGLRNMGFTNKATKFEKNLMISTWIAPAKLSKSIRSVELVHNGGNPIYTKYIDGEGKVMKKVYYYNFQKVGDIEFPLAVTQIDFFTAKDSVITKTSYSDVKINEAINNELINFTIPLNAKALK